MNAVGSDVQQCAPYWNFRARWLLFYVGPLGLLACEIGIIGAWLLEGRSAWAIPELGWDALNNRNFWVPLLWGFWMPWFNGPRNPVPGLKRIVFRDFNGNDLLPLAIPLMHALIWSACAALPLSPVGRLLAFAAAFLTYDILMLRFDLLQIYTPKFAARIGPKGVVKSYLTIWWLYLGLGLELVNQFGADSPLAVLGSAAALIVPMQIL